MEIIFIILITAAAICNAIMDKLQFHYNRSIFRNYKNQQWWNINISWRNKWKDGDPKKGEKFWGSSRWFVRFTDAWHFFQGLMWTCLFGAMIIYKSIFPYVWVDFIIIYGFFTTIFYIFFKYLLEKNAR